MSVATVLLLFLTSLPIGQASPGEAAGGTGYQDLSLAELADAKVGKEVRVTGKYRELIGQELTLFGCEIPFLLKSQEFSRKLLDFTPGHDNFTISGRIIQREGAERAVEVDQLAKGQSDFDIFSQEAREILKKGPEKAGLLLRLAKRIVQFNQEHQHPQLIPLAHRIVIESYRAREEALSPSDAEERILFVREIHTALNDRDLTVKFLFELAKKFPDHASVKGFLLELNCRSYQGRWVTHEEFKRLEGLVLCGDRWVTPADKHMFEALEIFRRSTTNLLLLRKRTDREYRWLAESGKVEAGMIRQEVQAAIGFPDRVRRKTIQVKEFDQWSYGEKYYYFYDGILVAFTP